MITSLYAGLLAFLFVYLSVHVIKGRQKFRVAIGDDKNPELEQRIRAHGNFTEYTPFFLLMLALTEYNNLHPIAIHALGALFLASRLFHAYAFIKDEKFENGKIKAISKFRPAAMISTFTAYIAIGCVLIFQYFT